MKIIFLLDCQISYAKCSSIMSSAAKNVDILATNLNVLHHYLDGLKLFSDLHL